MRRAQNGNAPLRDLLSGLAALALLATPADSSGLVLPAAPQMQVSALVVLRYQGSVTLPPNITPCSYFSGTVSDVAGCVFTCEGSMASCPVECLYDPSTGVLTILGSAGDTIVWHAWQLTRLNHTP